MWLDGIVAYSCFEGRYLCVVDDCLQVDFWESFGCPLIWYQADLILNIIGCKYFYSEILLSLGFYAELEIPIKVGGVDAESDLIMIDDRIAGNFLDDGRLLQSIEVHLHKRQHGDCKI